MYQTWSQPHRAMWQPVNRAALPSPGEFEHAKKAIKELEDVLKDALAVLEQAQSRVLAFPDLAVRLERALFWSDAALAHRVTRPPGFPRGLRSGIEATGLADVTKELDERKAWIAPIRKLPSELLSEIFIFGSDVENLAPVTITEVSRLWRAIVLATPRAWSLIYVSAPEHEHHLDQYVSTFVERSNPCLLHIYIRDYRDYDTDSDDSEFTPPTDRVLPLLRRSLCRIRCLSIGSWQLRKLSKECMPNLARLTITTYTGNMPPFFISRDRFPRLESIQSTDCPWRDSLSPTSFPPLQELAIQINDRSTWLDVVKNCSASLKSLTIVGKLRWREHVTIIFPRLQSLALSHWSDSIEPEEWSISMVTPSLISYDEFSPSTTSSRLHHSDVKSVTYLTISQIPDLVPYTSLRVLRLSLTHNPTYLANAGRLVEQLKRDNNISPALELVEFRLPLLGEEVPKLESIKRDVIEQIKSARPGIEVSFTRRFGPMPGSMEENSCKPGMPCSQELE